jgi:hypothetical protein
VQKFIKLVNAILLSNKFFLFIIGLLVFQALWLALSARYPLAFDENFHYGIIKLFSHQWGPFFTSTPVDSGAYGALTRDPSYLYQYLMSFPYRLIALFVHNEMWQIILLRLINIALFAAGLVAFRRLLSQLAIPKKLIHFSLLMFVLVPVVPFLAAHINYDNLLFLLIPVTLSLTLRCARALRAEKPLPAATVALLIISLLLTSLVKYVFLPVAVAIVIYLVVTWLRQPDWKRVLPSFVRSFRALRWWLQLGIIAGLLVSGGLFIERYGTNIIQYHDIAPECSKVESVEHCSQYGPWFRNYTLAAAKKLSEEPVNTDLFTFSGLWVYDLLYRLYFAINYDYSTKPPLILPFIMALVVTISGLLFIARWGVGIVRRNHELLLPLGAIVLYGATLFYKNYNDYLAYGERVAINGRYFIPFLPIIFVMVGLAAYQLLRRFKHRTAITAVSASLLLLVALQGGGLLTFIVLSDAGWYWPNDVVIAVNQVAHNLISPLILQVDYTSPLFRLLVQ